MALHLNPAQSRFRYTPYAAIAMTPFDRSHVHSPTRADHTHPDGHTHGDNHPELQRDHGHVHSEESRRRIINRLSRIEGHIRGIKTMVYEDRDCPDVLVQVAAVRGALDRVARIILDEHLSECVSRAAEKGMIDEEIDALKAALDRFLT